MSTGSGAAGLLWLWATVADLGHGDDPERPFRPAADRDHEAGPAGERPAGP